MSHNSKIFDNKVNIIFIVNIIHFSLKIFTKLRKTKLSSLFLIQKKFNFFFQNKKKVDFLNIYQSIYLQQIAILITVKFFIRLFGSKNVIYLENPSLSKLIQYCGKKSIKTFDVQHSMISNLNILSDDIALIFGYTKKNNLVKIKLTYFNKLPKRHLSICLTDGTQIYLNLFKEIILL